MVVLPLEPDLRIKVWVWPCNSQLEPLIFNFDEDDYTGAVYFAINVAREWRDVSKVHAHDCMGMRIIEMTPMWIISGPERFERDQKMGRRPPQPEFGKFRSITQGRGH